MIIPTETSTGNLPINFSGSPLEFYEAFRDRLRMIIPDDKVLTGYNGTSDPGIDLGPWVRNSPGYVGPNPPLELWSWSATQDRYAPASIHVGINTTNYVLIVCDAAGTGTNVFFQDKTGTIALLYDVYVPRATIILSGNTPTVNWSFADTFIHRLTGNATYTFSFPSPDPNTIYNPNGDKISIAIQNNATTFTATFPSTVQWEGGTQPAAPTGSAGKNAFGLFEFRCINNGTTNLIVGDLRVSSVASPSPEVDVDPTETAPPNYGHGSNSQGPHFLPLP